MTSFPMTRQKPNKRMNVPIWSAQRQTETDMRPSRACQRIWPPKELQLLLHDQWLRILLSPTIATAQISQNIGRHHVIENAVISHPTRLDPLDTRTRNHLIRLRRG